MVEQLGLFDVGAPPAAPVALRAGSPDDWLREAHALRVGSMAPECTSGTAVNERGKRMRRRAHMLEHDALREMGVPGYA